LRTLLSPVNCWHAAQVQVVNRFGIVARVAGFQKLYDRFLWRGPPSGSFVSGAGVWARNTPAREISTPNISARGLDRWPANLGLKSAFTPLVSPGTRQGGYRPKDIGSLSADVYEAVWLRSAAGH